MASKLNGRVFAGEDSEEEDEEEEGIAYSFQFSASSSASQASARASAPAPRFSVQAPVTVVAPAAGAGGEESDESDNDTAVSLQPVQTRPIVSLAPAAAVNGEDSEGDSDDDNDGSNANATAIGESARLADSALQIETASSASVKSPRLATPPPVKKKTPTAATAARPRASLAHTPVAMEADDAHWELDAASTGGGVPVMGDAIVSRLQPSLEDSIHRIAELTESQQHLLQLLAAQNASVCANEQIKRVAVVMDKLPHYVRKVQDLKAAMGEIAASVEKMKKRAESLRVDAQSHAIKKENKRDSMSQWNKMAAASASGASASRE